MDINKIKKFLPKFFYNFLKTIYHILRYHNLIKPKYSSSEKINFGQKEIGEFLKLKINNSKCYLEFGSGNTTIFASQRSLNYYSIESDKNFYNFLIKEKNIDQLFFYDLGYVQFYSYPLFGGKFLKSYYQKKAKNYASKIFSLFEEKKITPDLILVDGRYRVLCMLNIFLFLKMRNALNTCVIIDDFENREYYFIIKEFFKVDIKGRLGICFLKNASSIENASKLIEKYSLDPR